MLKVYMGIDGGMDTFLYTQTSHFSGVFASFSFGEINHHQHKGYGAPTDSRCAYCLATEQ